MTKVFLTGQHLLSRLAPARRGSTADASPVPLARQTHLHGRGLTGRVDPLTSQRRVQMVAQPRRVALPDNTVAVKGAGRRAERPALPGFPAQHQPTPRARPRLVALSAMARTACAASSLNREALRTDGGLIRRSALLNPGYGPQIVL